MFEILRDDVDRVSLAEITGGQQPAWVMEERRDRLTALINAPIVAVSAMTPDEEHDQVLREALGLSRR